MIKGVIAFCLSLASVMARVTTMTAPMTRGSILWDIQSVPRHTLSMHCALDRGHDHPQSPYHARDALLGLIIGYVKAVIRAPGWQFSFFVLLSHFARFNLINML